MLIFGVYHTLIYFILFISRFLTHKEHIFILCFHCSFLPGLNDINLAPK